MRSEPESPAPREVETLGEKIRKLDYGQLRPGKKLPCRRQNSPPRKKIKAPKSSPKRSPSLDGKNWGEMRRRAGRGLVQNGDLRDEYNRSGRTNIDPEQCRRATMREKASGEVR